MMFGLADEGANVTLNTDKQLVIKQCTEEFLVTLDQALTTSRRSIRPSGKVEEDQEGEAEGDIQPRARVADGQEGSKGRSPDVQGAKSPADPLTKAREKRTLFFNKTDEAKRVIEEDR